MTERKIKLSMLVAGAVAMERGMRRGLFGTAARRFSANEVQIQDLVEEIYNAMRDRDGESGSTAKEG